MKLEINSEERIFLKNVMIAFIDENRERAVEGEIKQTQVSDLLKSIHYAKNILRQVA